MKSIISTSGREASVRRYRALIEKLGLEDEVAYSKFSSDVADVDSKVDPAVFTAAIRESCLGGAISKDIKALVIPFCDELHETALEVQSVNTIVNKNGILKGYNTDAFGFRQCIESAIDVEVKTGIIYGYGGVTLVATHVLKSLGINDIYITGRNLDKAKDRAEELGVSLWSREMCMDLKDKPYIFVNASPVTDSKLESADNFLDSITCCDTSLPRLVFDHELSGEYLIEFTTRHNIKHVKGMEMYVPQMKKQWVLFLEGKASATDIEKALDDLI